MSTFKTKHVLITGGASGIGWLMAKQAVREEASAVTIWDIDSAALQQARQKLTRENLRLRVDTVDISNPEKVYTMAKSVLEENGVVDILINNAGIVIGKTFEQHDRSEIEQTVRTNLLGAMYVTHAFLNGMIEQHSGHIVNIASAAGLIPNPKMTVYASSKWGMVGWSESLRIELRQLQADVKVTTVNPGYINTGMFKGVSPPLLTPLLDPEDISGRIIKAVKANKVRLNTPFMVKLIPFLKGVMPSRVFDLLADKIFRVYRSMDTFTGKITTN